MSIVIYPENVTAVLVGDMWYDVTGGMQIGPALIVGGEGACGKEPWFAFRNQWDEWVEGPMSSVILMRERE